MSNTSPTRPYRSAGRPEVMYVMERLIDLACREHGFDRVEIRRRNLVKSTEFPYTNAFGMTYDSGDYHHTMEWVLRMGDWDGFAARRAAARARGKLRGIGVANYLDTATGVRARAHRDDGAARRSHRRRDRHELAGPGPRDELRPARHRVARRADREGALPHP